MKLDFNERVNRAYNFLKISIHMVRVGYWTIYGTSLRFGVCELIAECNTFEQCIQWIKRNIEGNTPYNLLVQDPYNDNKVWHVKHYKDGHYVMNQYIGDPLKRFNKRFVRVRKNLVFDIMKFPLDK